MPDKARKILFDTYWSREGWKRPPKVSLEDYAFAQEEGYMFEQVELDHDDLVEWLRKSFSAVTLERVRDGFLASLSTRRLELRSALGSYAIARHFPEHAYQDESGFCAVCGTFQSTCQAYDLSVLNFERYKWGGVRHEHPEYMAFDLEQFVLLERVKPTEQDYEIMRQILTAARQCEAKDRPRQLEKRLAKVLDSNKAEREILIDILGYCGILQAKKHPGYLHSYVSYSERTEPAGNRYWTYPVSWWRGKDGVNQAAVEYYFFFK